jgi:hypothetical protein
MSLINDALRRAKQAQLQNPSPEAAPPQFRPPDEPAHSTVRGMGLALPIACTILALLGLLALWEMPKRNAGHNGDEMVARANTNPQPAPSPANSPPTTPAPPVASPAVTVSPVALPQPAPALASAATNLPSVSEIAGLTAQQSTGTNVAVAPEPPRTPAEPRLQGILFSPSRPSAWINGKALFVGGHLGDMRVVAITRETVTLVGASKTNLLSLSE